MPQQERQAFQRPHTSLGMVAHVAKTIGILIPIAIPEFIEGHERQMRAIRLNAVLTAALVQGMWIHRIEKERQERAQRQR